MTTTDPVRTRHLFRLVGLLVGLVLVAGCYVRSNQPDTASGFRQSSADRNVSTRDNSVLIGGKPAVIELGVPFSIGASVEGRPIRAYRFGRGPIFIALIGSIHGSYEANTAALTNRFVEFLGASPAVVPSELSVFIIPTMNPDGLAERGPQGRVNANDVDLNRNWGCGWAADEATYQGVPFTTGTQAFSEPETRAVRDFLLRNDFQIAVFYHSRGAVVFYGECSGDGRSLQLAKAVSRATGYDVEHSAEYPTTRSLPGEITGEGADYFDSQGLAAIDVELTTRKPNDIDWEANRQGLLAIMDYAVRQYAGPQAAGAASNTPLPKEVVAPTPTSMSSGPS